MAKLHKKLYKLNTNGSVQFWSIFIDKDSYFTETGKFPDGKVITSEPTLVTPKANRTLEEQILLEVNSKINKKRDKNYVDSTKDIINASSELPGYEAMLAKKFKEHKKKIKYPCVVQPKLDGIRCIATKDGFFSRGRKQYTSCEHIWNELQPFFKANPDAVLDGELYTHAYKDDFEKICKSVKKTKEKAKPEDIEFQKMIQYHIYDAPRIGKFDENATFAVRWNEIVLEFNHYDTVVVVETIFNVLDENQIIEQKEKWVEEGYEGIMIRNVAMPYESKRSSNLLKLKDFQDAEFKIIGVKEGNGKLAGHAASFTCETKDGSTFDAKLKGSFERLKYLYEHQDEAIGKMMTVRYQNLTADNIPRFPVGIAIRDYE